jgi:hypothetical protein
MAVSCIRLLSAAALIASAVFAQDQNQRVIVRDVCVKVAPGKEAQFESFVGEFFMPMEKALADSGELAWWMAVRAVVPAGKSAPCDYRGVEGFHGYPADPDAFEAANAALKRAKLNMTAAEVYAKLGALSELVDVEYWVMADGVGGGQEKGSYLVLNHYKTSNPSEWLRLEKTYWKPLVAEHVKGGATAGWSAWEMWIPGGGPPGDSKPYNVQTVDQFPDWNSLVHGIPLGELWPKVHPNEEMTPFFEADAKAALAYDREIFKVVDIVSASNGSTR